MADFDPPWRLDPFQNIVEVGWGGVPILVLGFGYDYNGSSSGPFMATLTGLPWDTAYDLNGDDFIFADSGANAKIEETITPEMLAQYYMWSYPAYKTFYTYPPGPPASIVDVGVWIGYVDGRARYKETVRIGPSFEDRLKGGAILTDMRERVNAIYFELHGTSPSPVSPATADVVLVEVLESHPDVAFAMYERSVNQMLFFNVSKIRRDFLQTTDDPKNASPLVMRIETGTAKINELVRWSVGATSYRGYYDFSVADDNTPEWSQAGVSTYSAVDNNFGERELRHDRTVIALDTQTLTVTGQFDQLD